MAIALWVAERGGEELDASFSGLLQSGWLSLQGLLSGGLAHSPVTVPGKVISTGYTFLILVVMAGYTANLAAFLTISNSKPEYTGLADVVNRAGKVCLSNVIEPPILAQYPGVQVVPFADDNGAIAGLQEGKCQATVAEVNLFRSQQADELCDLDVVGGVAVSIPISLPLATATKWRHEVDYNVNRYRSLGFLSDWMQEYRPVPTCPVKDEEEDIPRLEVKHMLGGLAFTGVFLALGCILIVVQKIGFLQGLGAKAPAAEVEEKDLQKEADIEEVNPLVGGLDDLRIQVDTVFLEMIVLDMNTIK
eukprot:TRINITY_DN19421_c1_g1_i2.p1 TRINITY_DN19421_c1_g1~~TRINITY_DN19421_c1_g1_i2.p1  ORF type:complete len:305 (-),score=37.69 TRINITY_DN19421_c1_g1_i2:964-1878(-)